jgi:hypothetical protein
MKKHRKFIQVSSSKIYFLAKSIKKIIRSIKMHNTSRCFSNLSFYPLDRFFQYNRIRRKFFYGGGPLKNCRYWNAKYSMMFHNTHKIHSTSPRRQRWRWRRHGKFNDSKHTPKLEFVCWKKCWHDKTNRRASRKRVIRRYWFFCSVVLFCWHRSAGKTHKHIYTHTEPLSNILWNIVFHNFAFSFGNGPKTVVYLYILRHF